MLAAAAQTPAKMNARGAPRWLRAAFLLLATVGAVLVVLGGTAAVIVGFFALLLALDRAFPATAAGRSAAEVAFRRLDRARRREARRTRLRRRPQGDQRLLHLSEDDGWVALAERRHLGLQAIALDAIVGTVEPSKAEAFDHRFRPPGWSRERWTQMCLAAQRGVVLPPISVYRVGDRHFVRDGHHRVSVALALNVVAIEADVVELRPCSAHEQSPA